MKNKGQSAGEGTRLDCVVIQAAVTALFGPNAVVRRIAPSSAHTGATWLREGRLGLQNADRMAHPLGRNGPDRVGDNE